MRIRPAILVWTIIPFLLGIVLPCQAAQFTAELTITSPQGNFVYNLDVKDDLMRLEKTAGPMTVPPFPTIYNRVEYREPGTGRVAFRVWESTPLAFVVKTVSYATNGDATMALRNIQEGPVNDNRFAIPSGFTRVGPVAGAAGSRPETPDQAKKPSATGNLVLILDASGSMWGQVEGTAKIAIAKEVLTGLVEALPDDARGRAGGLRPPAQGRL